MYVCNHCFQSSCVLQSFPEKLKKMLMQNRTSVVSKSFWHVLNLLNKL